MPDPRDTPAIKRRLRNLISAIPEFGVPFLLLLYLALDGGGYDLIIRSQVGIVAWWLVLLGVGLGFLPAVKQSSFEGWLVAGLMVLLATWTALSATTWTGSMERSVVEVARVATLLGFYAFFLLVQRREGLRRALSALATVAGIVAAVSLLDRFDPGLFPLRESVVIPEDSLGARLRFPLDYWNGLAAFLAIGAASLLWTSLEGRTRGGRALACGTLPLVGLALYLTFSRGGLLATGSMILVFLVLYPRRLLLVLLSATPLAGSALLIWQVNDRPQLLDFVPSVGPGTEGSEMLWLSLGVIAGVAGIRFLLDWGLGSGRLRVPAIRARITAGFGLLSLIIVTVALLTGLVTGFFSERWEDFQQPPASLATSERLGSFGSSERFFLYDSALEAGFSSPLQGIGPGTFEYWWSREGQGEQFVRDAHSLYLESFAELGVPGLLLSLGLVFSPIVIGVKRILRHAGGRVRGLLAASVSGMTAFAVAAGIDWAWELTVIPAAFLLLAAATTGPAAEVRVLQEEVNQEDGASSWPWGLRIGGVVLAGLGIASIALPMLSTQLVRESQSEVRAGNEERALDLAREATSLEPWSASALIQEAQVLDLLGLRAEAVTTARRATIREPGNWRNWFVLATVARETRPVEARAALVRATELRARSGSLPFGAGKPSSPISEG